MREPVYTSDNCKFAGELKWGLSVFWRDAVLDCSWLDDLAAATKPDGIEVLKHRLAETATSQFELRSQPDVSPLTIVQRVKGRLQYLVRKRTPKPFHKNYALRSIGHVTRQIVEQYVARQSTRHRMADERVQRRFERFQIFDPDVDLSEPRQTAHARYWYNLHVTIVHQQRWTEIREEVLQQVHDMILSVSRAKGHRLSRGGILADHVHLALACPLEVAPSEIALGYLNNLAYVHGMKAMFQYGAHLRTFSEYDLGAVQGEAPGRKRPDR